MKYWMIVLICAFGMAACSGKTESNLAKNAGFENETSKVWLASAHAGIAAYKFDVVSDVAFAGSNSFRIEQYENQVYGIIKQLIDLPNAAGKTLNYSAMLKTQDIQQGNGLVLVVNFIGKDDYIISQHKSKVLTGSADWQKIEIKETVPKFTLKMTAGVMLQSKGVAWVDDVNVGLE